MSFIQAKIEEKTDKEVLDDMTADYNDLKEFFKELETVEMIKEGEALGSPKLPITESNLNLFGLVNLNG